jgi:dephospho-CoA kinase
MTWQLKQNYIRLSMQERIYQLSIPIVGLTGGIATGKTSAANFFRQQELPVISADKLIKTIYAWPETLEFLKREVPSVLEGYKILFPKLRELFFRESFLRQKLEGFLYTRLPSAFHHELQQYAQPQVVIYDVPLLFEKKLNAGHDQVICVYCNRKEQIERMNNRDGTTGELAQQILSCQWDIDKKREASDWIINNQQDTQVLDSECQKILGELFVQK